MTPRKYCLPATELQHLLMHLDRIDVLEQRLRNGHLSPEIRTRLVATMNSHRAQAAAIAELAILD